MNFEASDLLPHLHWQRLRKHVPESPDHLGIRSIALEVDTGYGPVRLGLGDGDEPRLLLPIRTTDRFPNVPEGPGLGISESTFEAGTGPSRFIDFICRDPELEAVFGDVVTEIVARVAAGEASGSALEAVVREFRDLLSRTRKAVQLEKIVGLLGELLLLNELLQLNPDAAAGWTGPERGRHDFRAGLEAFEVKTTLRSQKQTVEISAIDQLLEPDGGKLWLQHFSVERDTAGTLSVPDQAGKAVRKCNDGALLHRLFEEVEFDPENPGEWGEYSFSMLGSAMYRVTETFPRLVPATFASVELPPGVSHFRYRVDLSLAERFRVSDAERNELLGSFASSCSS